MKRRGEKKRGSEVMEVQIWVETGEEEEEEEEERWRRCFRVKTTFVI